MTLAADARLGPYEVVELLGAGGMGEVYRARDPRLGRDVAVKVLPAEVAGDAHRLGFFEREARAVAALNHPNILTVFDVGTHEGVSYVVTELLEGENLREVLSRRTPTAKQLLGYALQAARGLEAAHARDIVHRDLKPENLFLTTEGRVKILDFGLAKLVHREEVAPDAPTPSRPTTPGQLVGTVAYMSPEQARAQAVDARSDVFSFGVVLYELLSRKHPFRRETAVATLAAIMEESPPGLESLGLGVPPAVAGVVRRCLEQAREDRYASGHDVAMVLEAILAAPTGAAALVEVAERSPYPGLGSFTESDARFFFGREEEVQELWGRIRQRPFLAVIGPSGVGKTSFVRAGVVAGRPEGWAALVCTPGTAPMAGLGRVLVPQLVGDPEALQELPRFENPDAAFDLLARWRRGHEEALLVVDQFEELFTLNPPEVQGRFAGLLARLALDARVHVLLSLRDDFLMRCHDQEPLKPVFRELTPLGALTAHGLERALVEPARKQGYRFEDEALVTEMVSVVEGVRGALPLLAFAAARLWEKRDRERKLLTREACQEIAGVEGALAQHAEATMDRIGSEHQGLVREIFRNLVTAQGTRAVTDREELLSVFPDPEAAATVLNQLVDARLLTSYETEGKGGEPSHHRIEIVHESLLNAWPRLVRWQAQDEEGALLRDQLKQAAHLWDERDRTPDLLWSGTALQEYELWRDRYPGQLTALEEEFSRSMVERARRRRSVRRLVAASVVAIAVGVAAVTGVLWQRSDAARRKAETEVRQREAAQLLSLGRVRLEASPTAALAHALASLERWDNEPARRFAVEALWKGPIAHVVVDPINPAMPAWSPDGQWLAVGGSAGLILLHRDGRQHRLFDTDQVEPVGFSAESSRLVTRLRPNVLHLWSLPEGERLKTWTTPQVGKTLRASLHDRRLLTLRFDGTGPADRPRIVEERSIDGGPERTLGRGPQRGAIDPRGERLVLMEGGRLLLRRVDALDAPPRILGRHEGETMVGPWTWPDRVVTADATGEVRIWDADTGRVVRTLRSPADARGAAPDLSGRYLTASPSGLVPPHSFFLFDLETPRGADPLPLLFDEIGMLNGVAFRPDGLLLASGHYPYGTLLWNLATRRPVVLRGQRSVGIATAFTPDGRLVSTSNEGTVRLWPLWAEPDGQVRELWQRPGSRIGFFAPAVSPDGRFAVLDEMFAGRVIVVPLDGSPGVVHEGLGWDPVGSLAPDGRRFALAYRVVGQPELASLGILDLETGDVRTLRVDDTTLTCENGLPGLGPAPLPLWLADGRLVSEGPRGLRLWNLADGSSEQLRECRDQPAVEPFLAATPDSGTVVTLFNPRPKPGETSTLAAFELATRLSQEITEHGNRVSAFALDPTGTVLVTGATDGLVRVGPLEGGEPHLLYGHTGIVNSVAISPDGRWIASGANDETIRLWPMPDLSKAPLHAWPHEELLEKLRSFTNLRVVPDPGSDTGYKLEPDPYPGWREVPTW